MQLMSHVKLHWKMDLDRICTFTCALILGLIWATKLN